MNRRDSARIEEIARAIKMYAREIVSIEERYISEKRFNENLDAAGTSIFMAIANFNDCRKPNVSTRPDE